VVQTPNIDRVAGQGVLFRNAFAPAPSCTPCRSALLSGRYFFRCGRGAILQGAQWDPAIPSFPLLLRDAGYHIGKSHKVWSPGTPADAPFGGQRFAYERAGRLFNNFSENVTAAARAGEPVDAVRQRLLGEVGANFDAFLADRKPGQPFCYWYGPTTTHRTWVKGSGKALWGIDPDRLKGKLPPFLPDVPEIRQDFADYLGEVQAVDAAIGALLRRLDEIGEADRTLVVLSGDHGGPGFPRGKCNLYDFGTGVPLIAKWPGGKPGRTVTDLVTLMDLAPTFLDAAGLTPPPGTDGASLAPILRSSRSGRVQRSRDAAVTGRERHVAAAREGNLPYPQRALRTSEFLYIRNYQPDRWPMGSPGGVTRETAPSNGVLESTTYAAFSDMDASPTKAWLVAHRNDPEWREAYRLAFDRRPAEELYDLRRDPWQMRNIAGTPAGEGRLERLRQRLASILSSSQDPRVVGDGTAFDSPPFSSPFVAPTR
jgi:uncharacterized sulfatase